MHAGEIQSVFELERWVGIRQYSPNVVDHAASSVLRVLRPALRYMTATYRMAPQFDVLGVGKFLPHIFNLKDDMQALHPEANFVSWLRTIVQVGRVEMVDHHWAHASLVMYEDFMAGIVLIFSYDGMHACLNVVFWHPDFFCRAWQRWEFQHLRGRAACAKVEAAEKRAHQLWRV